MATSKTSNITANTKIHTGKGSVIYLIISHSEATTQNVTLYDSLIGSGTILSSFKISPEASPFNVTFPDPYYLRFTSGLFIVPGNCTVIVQSVGN